MDLEALEAEDYDEFGYLQVYADYSGVPWNGRPVVHRENVRIAPDEELSTIVWGEGEPELVFLHGGGQNAHTWDTVAMALGRPVLAVDLPGHGRSYRRDSRDYTPWSNAESIAELIRRRAPEVRGVVGMSLGGLTAITLAAGAPELVRHTVVVDITPSIPEQAVNPQQLGPLALIGGPRTFESFNAMLAAAAAAAGRTPESMAIGVRHNARRDADGQWSWAYDIMPPSDADVEEARRRATRDFAALWDDVAALQCPTMLVRGGNSPLVHDDHVVRFRETMPGARVEVVDGAGHSVQSDRPLELAALVEEFVFTAR